MGREECTAAAVAVEAAAAVVVMAVAVLIQQGLIQQMAAAMTVLTITGLMATAIDNRLLTITGPIVTGMGFW